SGTGNLTLGHVVIAAPKDKEIHGQLFVPKPLGEGMERLIFSVAPTLTADSAQEKFYEGKLNHYARLQEIPNVAGAAWIRHQIDGAVEELNKIGHKAGRPAISAPFIWTTRNREDAYELFSGGRAVSENLQLDRQLREGQQNEKPDIEINS